jgi:hypothetical protein
VAASFIKDGVIFYFFFILRQLKGCFPFSFPECNIVLIMSTGVNCVEFRNIVLLACLALGGTVLV